MTNNKKKDRRRPNKYLLMLLTLFVIGATVDVSAVSSITCLFGLLCNPNPIIGIGNITLLPANDTVLGGAYSLNCSSTDKFSQLLTNGSLVCTPDVSSGNISAVKTITLVAGLGSNESPIVNNASLYLLNASLNFLGGVFLGSNCTAGSYYDSYYSNTTPVCTPEVGDISGVIAGTGMTGGGTSGSVTLNINPTIPFITEGNMTSTLPASIGIPQWLIIFVEFFGDAVLTDRSIFGTENVTFSDLNKFGVNNYLTGASVDNDAGVSIGATQTTTASLYTANYTNSTFIAGVKMVLSTGRTDVIGLMKVATALRLSTARTGLMFFRNTTTSANWTAQTCNAGTCTNTTLQAGDTNFHDFKINVPYGTFAEYYIDNVLVANHSTNLPTTDIAWIGMWSENNLGTAINTRVDYIYYRRPR